MSRATAIAQRHHIDVHVGKRLGALRAQRGLNQTDIGRILGLTFQQIQKYEKGTNRMSSSVLHTLATDLGVPVQYFFDGLGEGEEANAPTEMQHVGKHGAELARIFVTLDRPKQNALLLVARNFVSSPSDAAA